MSMSSALLALKTLVVEKAGTGIRAPTHAEFVNFDQLGKILGVALVLLSPVRGTH
jgi:hypothetical protein